MEKCKCTQQHFIDEETGEVVEIEIICENCKNKTNTNFNKAYYEYID